ncbi:MAG TPA: alpha-glucan family phosphorylase [Planctomycetota bacterium]|nr:alpha-glucan family phosphorylase [Planctomycetota bacterium]
MKIHPYVVAPNLPPRLQPLREMAMNLWYSWNWDAKRLFIRMDGDLWDACGHSPIRMLGQMPQARLEEFAKDESFIASVERTYEQFKSALGRSGWFGRAHADRVRDPIAYFSAEYGLDVALPIYSGGLGVLSGDHLKTASDLGLPLVAVGLLYSRGYGRQYLNADGWQQEEYPENDWYTSPVVLERTPEGRPREVAVSLAGAEVRLRIWRVDVGRIPLYLLDSNVEGNPPDHRGVTAQLYGGDRETRLKQEIALGIGGVRALRALGIRPAAFHINEGHSAFLVLERMRQLVAEEKLSFDEAREAVWASNVFTTHTPVPAGNERFDPGLVWKYLAPAAGELGIAPERLLELGRAPGDGGGPFCMTTLALRHSAHCNGVSRLHGAVARGLWRHLWPGVPEDEVPIRHVTNGVHGSSWVSHDMEALFQTYIGPRYQDEPWSVPAWARVDQVPDGELWRTHEARRERLVFYARRKLRQQLQAKGAAASEVARADETLDARALTIGFARRFATYKRAVLAFTDPERLAKLVSDSERPVQFIFAGKAHPQDQPGKEFIKMIAHFARDPRFRGRVVFLEDHDMELARYLVQGCDVWLNTPRRPYEASGTSGMKAVINGALHMSVPDGWWEEGYSPGVGWAIGGGEMYADEAYQDFVESRAIYDLLEQEVVPLFYTRDKLELPRGWIGRMKASIKSLAPRFSSHRMVMEYAERFYVSGSRKFRELEAESWRGARELAAWRARVRAAWPSVRVTEVESQADGELRVGQEFRVRASVELGPLKPDDVAVEIESGPLDTEGKLQEGVSAPMAPEGAEGGVTRFAAMVPCRSSGRHGFAVRVLPSHPSLVHPYDEGLIAWA